MLQNDAWAAIMALRRQGFAQAILGGTDISDTAFTAPFRSEPEEQREPNFFSHALFGAAPVMLDSANAQTLEFVDRFRKRHGEDQTRSS